MRACRHYYAQCERLYLFLQEDYAVDTLEALDSLFSGACEDDRGTDNIGVDLVLLFCADTVVQMESSPLGESSDRQLAKGEVQRINGRQRSTQMAIERFGGGVELLLEEAPPQPKRILNAYQLDRCFGRWAEREGTTRVHVHV